MQIVLGSDDRYALPLAVSVHSALRRIKPAVQAKLIIVDAGLTAESRKRIDRVIRNARPNTEVQWIKPDTNELEGMRTTHWGSPASYLPLLIPAMIEDDGHVLYLDSDLLIFHDLTDLWNLRINNKPSPVHAVLDYGFHFLGEALKGDACARLGLDAQAPYFNSGVLLIDLGVWRARKIAEKALHFARDHPEVMRFTDQDALNAVIQGDWTELDLGWNVLVGSVDRLVDRTASSAADRVQERNSLLAFPKILHFSGPQKPWKPGYGRSGKREYHDELRASGWFNSPTEYWSWRTRKALFSPYVKARRAVVNILWPPVVKIRQRLTEKPTAAHGR